MTPTSIPSECSESSLYHSQTQRKSKNGILYEITNHTWRFPPSEVARMLSLKTSKYCLEVAGELLLLDQYDCMADKLALQDALNDVVTQLENDDILTSRPFDVHNLTSFLTRCVLWNLSNARVLRLRRRQGWMELHEIRRRKDRLPRTPSTFRRNRP